LENTWNLSIRRGWIVGLFLTVVAIAATVGLTVMAVITPLSIRVFLMALGACLTLGLAIRIAYQLWGLINASYELNRNALTIHWGPVEHQIPMGSIREVVSAEKLPDLRIRPSLRWPGYFVALGSTAAEDGAQGDDREAADHEPDGEPPHAGAGEDAAQERRPVLFYATTRPSHQVILRTRALAYAISPADTDGFLTALRERLEMGPTQEVEERSRHPGFLDWAIWRDRWALAMLVASFALLILLVGLLCWRYPTLPEQIALRLTPAGVPLLITRTARIFYLTLVGTVFAVVNSGLGLLLYHRERALSYFLWSGLLATMISLWAAVVSILLMQ
jgi:hypothetical protein